MNSLKLVALLVANVSAQVVGTAAIGDGCDPNGLEKKAEKTCVDVTSKCAREFNQAAADAEEAASKAMMDALSAEKKKEFEEASAKRMEKATEMNGGVEPKYMWEGKCIATADCGGAVPEADRADAGVNTTYECGATTLAASMLATAAIVFTM